MQSASSLWGRTLYCDKTYIVYVACQVGRCRRMSQGKCEENTVLNTKVSLEFFIGCFGLFFAFSVLLSSFLVLPQAAMSQGDAVYARIVTTTVTAMGLCFISIFQERIAKDKNTLLVVGVIIGVVSFILLIASTSFSNVTTLALIATAALGTCCLLSYWFCWACAQNIGKASTIVSIACTFACLYCLLETIVPEKLAMVMLCVASALSTCAMIAVKLRGATEGKFLVICNSDSDKRSKIHVASTIKSSMDNFEFGVALAIASVTGLQTECLIVAAVASIGFLILDSKTRLISERSIASVTPPAVIAAFCALFVFGEIGQAISLCLLSFAFVLVTCIEYMALVGHVRMSNLSPLRVFSKARRIEYFATAVGTLCGTWLIEVVHVDWLLGVRLSICFAIVYALVFFICHRSRFPEVGLEGIGGYTTKDVSRREMRCIAVSEANGLSKRQYEVLVLIVQGRSAKYISQALSISLSTAQTHTRNIYYKVGVHSRQELIDMVDNTKLYGEE